MRKGQVGASFWKILCSSSIISVSYIFYFKALEALERGLKSFETLQRFINKPIFRFFKGFSAQPRAFRTVQIEL